ncbi:MAG: LPXTG cell wall anchor domain-containing protein [Oscillospiraceae bacterium]
MIKTSKTADGDVPSTGVEDMTVWVALAAAVFVAALAISKKERAK